MKEHSLRLLGGLAGAASVAAIAERRGSLSPTGGMAATLVGALAFANGWSSTGALLTFFVTSTALSHLPRDGANNRPRRSGTQVLANGGVACAAWAARLLGGSRRLDQLALGSLATAAADTWATEIGQRWGGTPRLITNGRPVKPGESGGVTVIGTLAAVAGALTVAIFDFDRRGIVAATASGLLGSIVDSVLGATLQARYTCRICSAHTEHSRHCGQTAGLLSGFSWMTNDTVNAIATLIGGIACAGLIKAPPAALK